MALSDKIKERREARHMTQQQLADRLYVSRQTVCRWENGTRCPDLIMAKQLASELGVTLDDLISEEDIEKQKNRFPFHSGKVREREKLEKQQKRIAEVMQIFGALFLAITVFCRIRLEIRVPMWVFATEVCAIVAILILRYRISRRLDTLYGADSRR